MPPTEFKLLQVHVLSETPSPSLQHLLEALKKERFTAVELLHPTLAGPLLEQAFVQDLPNVLLIDLDGCPPSALPQTELLRQWCQQYRQLGQHHGARCDILVLDCPEDGPCPSDLRIEVLSAGADAVLAGHQSHEELNVALLAHLRRHLDAYQVAGGTPFWHSTLLDRCLLRLSRRPQQTLPPLASPTATASGVEAKTLLSCTLRGTEAYQNTYGSALLQRLQGEWQTLLCQVLQPTDALFCEDDTHWHLLCPSDKAERLPALLLRRFEALRQAAYHEADVQRGWQLWLEGGVGTKIPLMQLGIGLVALGALGAAGGQTPEGLGHVSTLRLRGNTLAALALGAVQQGECGHWLKESPKLEDSLMEGPQQPPPTANGAKGHALVVEADAPLALLLQSVLQYQGWQVQAVPTLQEAETLANNRASTQASTQLMAPFSGQAPPPLFGLMVVDLEARPNTPEVWQGLARLCQQVPLAKVVATSVWHQPAWALQAGAAVFLPKPYELGTLLATIQSLTV
jgi:DNA-binding response OmpR family regulator